MSASTSREIWLKCRFRVCVLGAEGSAFHRAPRSSQCPTSMNHTLSSHGLESKGPGPSAAAFPAFVSSSSSYQGHGTQDPGSGALQGLELDLAAPHLPPFLGPSSLWMAETSSPFPRAPSGLQAQGPARRVAPWDTLWYVLDAGLDKHTLRVTHVSHCLENGAILSSLSTSNEQNVQRSAELELRGPAWPTGGTSLFSVAKHVRWQALTPLHAGCARRGQATDSCQADCVDPSSGCSVPSAAPGLPGWQLPP